MRKSHLLGPLYALCIFFFSQGAFGETVNGCVIEPETNCSGSILLNAALEDADLSNANLSAAILENIIMPDATLVGADLSEAILRSVNLRNADLSGANLQESILEEADLSGAKLSGANLSDAELWGATLTGATYNFATVFSADYDPIAHGATLVPVPAAVWLFGSALAGLLGITRMRKQAV